MFLHCDQLINHCDTCRIHLVMDFYKNAFCYKKKENAFYFSACFCTQSEFGVCFQRES